VTAVGDTIGDAQRVLEELLVTARALEVTRGAQRIGLDTRVRIAGACGWWLIAGMLIAATLAIRRDPRIRGL